MIVNDQRSDLFIKFIKTFSPVGFKGIDHDDPLFPELEEVTKFNNQFFFICD